MLTALISIGRTVYMATSRARVKKSYHHGNLREDLVAAALEIITRRGPGALTLRSVAKRLGVSQTAPYRHFTSKDALLAAVAAQGFDALLARVRTEVAAAGSDVIARFQAIALAYVDFALEHPAHFSVMYEARAEAFAKGPVADLGRAAFKLLIELIVACQKAGLAAPENPSRIAVEVWSFAHGLVVLHQNGLLPRSLDEGDLRNLAARTTRFLQPPPSRGSRRDPM
jgi:AcrR family transcriptional regulator